MFSFLRLRTFCLQENYLIFFKHYSELEWFFFHFYPLQNSPKILLSQNTPKQNEVWILQVLQNGRNLNLFQRRKRWSVTKLSENFFTKHSEKEWVFDFRSTSKIGNPEKEKKIKLILLILERRELWQNTPKILLFLKTLRKRMRFGF